MSMEDTIIHLFCMIADELQDVKQHDQAQLHPSEIVTLGVLYAMKGHGYRAFYRWLFWHWRHFFPNLPEMSRLHRLLAHHSHFTDRFLQKPTFFTIMDSYGIELIHPIREGRSPAQVGAKGISNKQELRESIDRMTETNEFLIVTFSDVTEVLGGKKEWREATTAGRRKMYPFIEAQGMGSNTLPLPAFKVLFGEVRPRPDAIYFMTDGEFDEAVVQEVALMQSKLPGPVPIHCICFASQSGEVLMKRIAEQSKGTYTFVPGP